jgi:hypothetical protein
MMANEDEYCNKVEKYITNENGVKFPCDFFSSCHECIMDSK